MHDPKAQPIGSMSECVDDVPLSTDDRLTSAENTSTTAIATSQSLQFAIATGQIAQAMIGTSTLEELLQLALDQTKAALQVQQGFLFLLDLTLVANVINQRIVNSSGSIFTGGELPWATDVYRNYQETLRQEGIVVISGVERSSSGSDNFASLLVLVQFQRSHLGYMALRRNSQQLWAEDEVRFVQTVANQCAIAIQQRLLQQQLEAQSQAQTNSAVQPDDVRNATPSKNQSDELFRHVYNPTQDAISLPAEIVDTGLRALINTIPDYIFVIDRAEMRILMCNQAYAQFWGYSSYHELQGKTVSECFPKHNAARFDKQNQKVFETGKTLRFQETITLPKGTYHFDTIKVPLKHPNGEVYALLGTARDISEHKQLEAALSEREQQLWAIAANIPGTIYRTIFHADGHVSLPFVSESLKEVAGISAEAAMANPRLIFDAVHPDDRQAFDNRLQQAILDLKPINQEFRIVTTSGEVKWLQDCSYYFRLENGDTVADGATLDITPRKQIEAALRESELKIRYIVENIPDIIFIKDTEGRYSLVNPAGAQHLKLSVEDIVGKTDSELFDSPFLDEISRIDHQVMTTRKPYTYETNHCTNDDVSITFLVNKFPYIANDGTLLGLIGICHNISDRKRGEEQLRASLAEKEVLIKEIHHRVKNNLQTVSSLLRLQAASIKDAGIVELLKESQNRVRAMALVHERLYQAPNLACVNAAVYIEDLVADLFRSCVTSSKTIKVHTDLADAQLTIDTMIPCGLLLNELVSNAFKHAFPSDRPGEINVSFLPVGSGQYTLVVKDNGIGLPEDFNIHQSKSLGLRLISSLTQQIQGKLKFENNNGSTFSVTFAVPEQ